MSSSPEALYHSIPQAPVASNPILNEEDDVENDLELEGGQSQSPIIHVVADARIRWIYFVMGAAVLLPWNALITATPYFISRLANSPLQSTFSSYLSITFTISNFVCLAHATLNSKGSSPSRQTIICLLLLSSLCFILTLSTFVQTSATPFFAFVMFNAVAQAASGSYLQTSVIAVASRFGHSAVQSMLSGQAAVAVAVSTIQVFSAAASVSGQATNEDVSVALDRQPEERAAFLFFGLSTIFLLGAAAAQWWLVTLPQYHAVAGSLEPGRRESGSVDEVQALVSEGRSDPSKDTARLVRIFKTNILYEIAVSYVFIVTLAVFPPITASVKPVNPSFHPLLFTSVHFLVFGIGDWIGRYLCSIPRLLIWSARRLLIHSLSRTIFVVLFLMCNISRPTSSPSTTPFINSDFLFMLILFAFGITNGYVSSLCMMAAPSLEHNPRLKRKQEDIDVAATVAQFCLVGGLCIGSMASFAVRSMVCSCNPFTT